jgi:hypothetical protein
MSILKQDQTLWTNGKNGSGLHPIATSLLYQIRRPLGLAFVIYFWWLGDLLPLYI